MAKKVKYIASLVIFALIAFAFIFSTVFRISNRNIPKASAIDGYGFDASTGTLTVMGPTNDEVTASDVISACEDKSNIKKVIIIGDIAKIGDGALESCKNLSEITFGGTLNAIGENAFKDCTSLQAIDIPSAEEEENLSIGANAFNGCSALEEISFSDVPSLTGATMESYAFSGIPENCTVYAGDSVINSNNPDYSDVCTKLKAAGIPEKCLSKTEDEKPYSFDTNTGILTIKGNVETVTQAMVAEACGEDYKTTLKEVIIEEGVTSIGTNAFSGCENLASITIPNSVTSIGNSAFSTSALESVTIPEGVKSIGNSAFYQCQKIESITIPKSVESIGQYAFAQCYSLNKITFSGEIIPTLGEKAFWTIADAGEIYLNGQRVKGGSAAFNTLNDAGVPEAWFEKTSITADMFELKNTKKIYDGKAEDVEILHPDDLISYYLQYSKANSDGTWGDFTEDKPLNAGIYKIGVVVKDDEIYKDAELELNGDFTISKATPTADMFTFNPPENSTYDGKGKSASVVFNTQDGKLSGMGNITVKYSADDGSTWNTETPKNAGTYYVGITVDEGENYSATTGTLTNSNWNFTISKAIPTADMFTFTPQEDLTYNGEGKTASVTPNDGIEGMGTVTVKYYCDAEFKNELKDKDGNPTNPKNAGTYYVGINVTEDKNYLATTEILKKDEWNFQITKATPTADMFTFIPPKNNGDRAAFSFNPEKSSLKEEDVGEITVWYSKQTTLIKGQPIWNDNWTTDAPKDAGSTYRCGITTSGSTNCHAATKDNMIINNSTWTFIVPKIKPTADVFTFNPQVNLTYDGEGKTASVTPNDGIEGMGTVTVKYYSDSECKNIIEGNPTNTGTYYVGIDVTEGENYLATTETLKSGNWKFEINKAVPNIDFTIIKGGLTGSETVLMDEPKEITYNTALKYNEKSLPTSNFGAWSYMEPEYIFNTVGSNYIDIMFTPNDAYSYNNYNWSSASGWDEDSKKIKAKLQVFAVDKTNWGNEKDVGNGIKNYVSDDGTTSVEITGTNGRYWVKEESYDIDLGKVTSAWYGVDNSSGVFEPGSRLCVRWINEVENPDEWKTLRGNMDMTETQEHEWIFIAEVIHPDGKTRYTQLPQPVSFYVQKGEDWDSEDDLGAIYLSEGKDEDVFKGEVNIDFPEGTGTFMKLKLNHFSPYAVYDKPDFPNTQPGANNQNNNQESQENQQQENESGSTPDTLDSDNNTKGKYNKDNKDNEKNKKIAANNNNYIIWVLAGTSGLGALAALWWLLLYKRKKKNKNFIAKSLIAEIGNKMKT